MVDVCVVYLDVLCVVCECLWCECVWLMGVILIVLYVCVCVW